MSGPGGGQKTAQKWILGQKKTLSAPNSPFICVTPMKPLFFGSDGPDSIGLYPEVTLDIFGYPVPLSQRQTSNGMTKPILYHKTHTARQKSYCISFAMPLYFPWIQGKTHVISAPPYQWLFPCSNLSLVSQGHQQLSRAISHQIWVGLNEGHNDEEY